MRIECLLRVPRRVSIAEVGDILSSTVPADSRLLALIGGVDERLHALIVQTIWLGQVADVDANECVLSDVHDGEVVPLEQCTICVRVILQIEVVLTGWLRVFSLFLLLTTLLCLRSFFVFVIRIWFFLLLAIAIDNIIKVVVHFLCVLVSG